MRSSSLAAIALATLVCFCASISLPPSADARPPRRKKRKTKTGQVTIYCFIKGAKVELNNKVVGTTPLKPLTLRPGRYNLRVFKRGYKEHAQTLTIAVGVNAEVDADLFAFAGWIVVAANVRGATVAVDGKLAGKVPLDRDIIAGKHEITVQAPGHLPFQQTLDIAVGKAHPINVVLRPIPPSIQTTEGGITSKWWFWTVIGVVAAGGAAAGLVLGLKQDAQPKAPDAAFQIQLP